MDQFPYNYEIAKAATTTATPVAAKTKREVKKEDIASKKELPPNVRNEWNEYRADALPKFQMDDGSKETLDETHNFSEGVSALVIQTNENQTSYKDLLRRPTLLMNRVSVPKNTKTNSAFFIPLQPPNRQFTMVYDETKKEFKLNTPWASTLYVLYTEVRQ